MPTINEQPTPETEVILEDQPELEPLPEEQTEPVIDDTAPPIQQETEVVESQNIQPSEVSQSKTDEQRSEQQEHTDATPQQKAFSAAASLDQLRALNQDLEGEMFEQVFIDRNKPSSGSIMHGNPEVVPHSVQEPSENEKKKTATQQMGSGIAITKGENGSCTITRDLGHVGMEGLTSVEGFRCGPTELEKAYRNHMKKWQKKYGKRSGSSK